MSLSSSYFVTDKKQINCLAMVYKNDGVSATEPVSKNKPPNHLIVSKAKDDDQSDGKYLVGISTTDSDSMFSSEDESLMTKISKHGKSS